MSSIIPAFNGFKKGTFKFLADLEKDENNNTEWFAENRVSYDNDLVLPSKSFIVSIGQFFNHLNPAIRTEPKFNKTIMRINKDMRFAKGGPYRNYFLLHFGRFKMDSEFFVYLDKTGIEYGVFLNNTEKEELYFKQNIQNYREKIIETSKNFKIDNKFDLYELNNEPQIVIENFNCKKHFKEMSSMKYVLIQKKFSKRDKIIFSPDFLTEMIKAFSRLYPLYCFAISPEPLKLLDDFEERMGIAI